MLLQITAHSLYFTIQGTFGILHMCITMTWHGMTSIEQCSFEFDRASPSEFVVPLAKYNKVTYTQVSLGMRFRMMFETEESGVRRYMGTITGINDLDPVRWKSSQWRNIQVLLKR